MEYLRMKYKQSHCATFLSSIKLTNTPTTDRRKAMRNAVL